MKKIIFITTRAIYPITGGREVVLYNYCKGLNEFYNCEVNLISFIDEKGYNLTPEFIENQFIIDKPKLIEKLKNILINSFLLKRWPIQVSLYYSKKTANMIQEIVDKINPDFIIFDMARTAEYVKNLNKYHGKKILDMDDLISKRYIRQSKNINKSNNILGQYQKNVPKILNRIVSRNFIKKSVLKFEGKLLGNYEKKISTFFDNIIFVSPKETEEFNIINNNNKSICATIGVDLNYYSELKAEKDKNLIGFLGNMYIPHNQDAVDYFLENIFPKVKEKIPLAKFRIVGKCSEKYKEKFIDRADIEVTGEVSDIRPFVQECNVSVAPLIYGSGIKTKVLETMAMGVPVVTNLIGAEGIKVKNGFDIFICDDVSKYVDKIVSLLEDNEINNFISHNGINTIKNSYVWEKTLEDIGKILC